MYWNWWFQPNLEDSVAILTQFFLRQTSMVKIANEWLKGSSNNSPYEVQLFFRWLKMVNFGTSFGFWAEFTGLVTPYYKYKGKFWNSSAYGRTNNWMPVCTFARLEIFYMWLKHSWNYAISHFVSGLWVTLRKRFDAMWEMVIFRNCVNHHHHLAHKSQAIFQKGILVYSIFIDSVDLENLSPPHEYIALILSF